MSKRSLGQVFIDAFDGVAKTFVEQRNFRIQLAAAVIAIGGAVWLHFTPVEWACLSLVIGFVLAAELFNTCLEHAIDMVQPDTHPLARAAKHAGAAAVLAASCAAIAVGIWLYGTALLRR